jgi:SAM-dependent methyltransferase
MGLQDALAALWKRAMLSGTAFADRHGKLRLLYSLEDPWDMVSAREQYRFTQTNAQLVAVMPRYGNILELGCGEGHQSLYLQKLTDHLFGIELSARAVARAKRRCQAARFAVGNVDDASDLFPEVSFDLITVCEVLYYARDPSAILQALQQRTQRIYVSNYLPRFDRMQSYFKGVGWRNLPSITHGETVWACSLWEAPAVRQAPASAQTGCT